jgi:magnesium-transporting ATPase (P-type)
VFLADVVTDKRTGEEQLEWKSSLPNLQDSNKMSESNRDNFLVNTLQTTTDNFLIGSQNQSALGNGSLPWSYKDKSVEVALTGKAFRMIEQKKASDPFTFKSVLAKAQVFARMSPDDKALLVTSLQESYLD